jgi:hypothetical protein
MVLLGVLGVVVFGLAIVRFTRDLAPARGAKEAQPA